MFAADDHVSSVLSALPIVAHTFSMNVGWLIGNCLKSSTSCLKPKNWQTVLLAWTE